jgi:purine-nucleoside/S-methyl-5'-thioadenosine phosphorylase / adenosine deaminase
VLDRTHRLPALRVPGWDTIPNLVHGFLGRRGGVSCGPFAQLNLSYHVGDAPEMVQENWRRVGDDAGGLRWARMQQVHGDRVVIIDNVDLDGGEADAMVTGTPGTAAGVLTADCVPILLVAPGHQIVAAVHAGWRGTLAGVARRAVQHIEQACGTQAAEVHAALGPSIDGCCYEVDRSIADALEQRWGAQSDAVSRTRGSKPMVDLRRINTAILEGAGVRRAQIVTVGPCTRCAATEYFSHRAANGPTGRQWSFIGWQA